MKRKRFIKLAMAQTNRNTAQFAADLAVIYFKSYDIAYDEWRGCIGGRFEESVKGNCYRI